jgi:hypothetical protein
VGGTRTSGRQAHPDFAGELGVGHRHEGRHLFVPDLNEIYRLGPLQGSDQAVDAIAWVPVDTTNSPSVQTFNNKIADFHGELRSSQ